MIFWRRFCDTYAKTGGALRGIEAFVPHPNYREPGEQEPMETSPQPANNSETRGRAAGPRGSATVLPLRRPRDLHVIYNPAAGRRHRRLFGKTLRALVHRGCRISVTETTGAGQATEIAAGLVQAGHDAIVVAGGDGTISETIDGLADGGVPVGIIPLGTANVLANEIGMKMRSGPVSRTLAKGHPKKIYLGRVECRDNARLFTLMVSAGLDAQVVAHVPRRLKKLLGKGAYVLQSLIELLRYKPAVYTVTVDGEIFEAASVVVSNSHYYAGRFVCAPDARLDDGKLYACLFTRPGRWNVVRYAVAMLFGRLHKLKDYRVLPAKWVTIEGPEGEPVQADGDTVGELPVAVEMAGDSVELICPRTKSRS